jgi:pimeloyl-ACP methyl ester carboxylesterase
METAAGRAFRAAELRRADAGTAQIAYRELGSGRPLLLIHGWPLGGFTWRHCVPGLANRRRCIVPDSPGAGETTWTPDHAFGFRGQAEAYARFLDRLGIRELDILAHDTGATIARELALIVGARVGKLAMINTEVPHHRPPFIRMFQRLTRVPGAARSLRTLLRSRRFRRSAMGFGGCFVDLDLLDGEFHDAFVAPLIASAARMTGVIRYLHGIDWALVDSLAERHRDIAAATLLVWGTEDPTFPLARGRELVGQLAHCAGLREVPGAKLLVHEEKPGDVVEHVLEFLDS